MTGDGITPTVVMAQIGSVMELTTLGLQRTELPTAESHGNRIPSERTTLASKPRSLSSPMETTLPFKTVKRRGRGFIRREKDDHSS